MMMEIFNPEVAGMESPSTKLVTFRRMAAGLLILCGLMLASHSARAGLIIDSDPGSVFIVSPGETIAAFNFDLAGQAPLSANVFLPDVDVAFVNTAAFFLDGVLLGNADFGFDQSLSFALPDISALLDGVALLTWDLDDYSAGCPCVISEGGERIEIVTRNIPEPTVLTLLGAGLIGFGIARRRVRG